MVQPKGKFAKAYVHDFAKDFKVFDNLSSAAGKIQYAKTLGADLGKNGLILPGKYIKVLQGPVRTALREAYNEAKK